MLVGDHLISFEINKETKNVVEAECLTSNGANEEKAKRSTPKEATKNEIFKEECKVEGRLAQELGVSSYSQIVHQTSQGIILDPTLVTFPSSCNLGKKIYHELVQNIILDLFSMLEFNVPLLVVLEPMPTYATPSYNLCIYKEACRPYPLLIENVVEQHVTPLSLLSHEDLHTSLGSFDSCLVNVDDACMNSLDDDSSIVSMSLDVTSPKHDNCDLDDVGTFTYSLSSYNPLEKGCLFNFVDKSRLEGVLDLMMEAGLQLNEDLHFYTSYTILDWRSRLRSLHEESALQGESSYKAN